MSHLKVNQVKNVNQQYVSDMVAKSLAEDIHTGDISAQLISPEKIFKVKVITREDMVLCGSEWVKEVFLQIDKNIHLEWYYKDGDRLVSGSEIFLAEGSAQSILSAERVALNFLQMLSATATKTANFISLISHTNTKLLDTRKTIPMYREAQKYAVYCGGGMNHRSGLYDGFLIKENHINAIGSITKAIVAARKLHPEKPIEVEVENIEELKEALLANVDIIMLDNFTNKDKRYAVQLTDGRAMLEASGNVDEKSIVAVSETGIDFISVGSLTKNVKAIDLSMRFV